ncbi:hypothetical protein N9878_01225 [bacterium]|nr:hypothetical protein [bacterium]
MATLKKTVSGTFTDTTDPDVFKMQRGGVFVADAQCNSGSLTLTLKISLDGGSTFVDAYDASGAAITKAITTSIPHWHVEFLAQPGVHLFLDPSSASTPDVDYSFGKSTSQGMVTTE